jgi:integrase/recombinase XerD
MKLKKFKNWLIINDYSEHTIKDSSYVIKKFFKEYKQINTDNIYEWLLKMREEVAKSTFNKNKRYLKLYLKFLGKHKDIELPKSSKITQKIPKYITEDYLINEVIPVAVCVSSKPIRDKAILYFLFYTGIRPNELISLKREDIDLEKREAKIKCSKQSKERIIYLSPKLCTIISAYFKYKKEKINAFNISSESALSAITRKVKANLDIDEFHPYILRHSFATHLRMNDCPLEIIQELMGHKDISSTQIYAHINNKKLKSNYDKYMK